MDSIDLLLFSPLVLPVLFIVSIPFVWKYSRVLFIGLVAAMLLSLQSVRFALGEVLFRIADCQGGDVAFRCVDTSLEPLVFYLNGGGGWASFFVFMGSLLLAGAAIIGFLILWGIIAFIKRHRKKQLTANAGQG